ncbi:hypothetical protein [Methanolobus vulcani]|uniref:Uncharacterized protein n=1 Tax=Methanolobus vulcani TaxID=38026 RepID=A0A7Z8KQJ8_9EURY|nr:hypothetical protein [Methanolobus vulcani]TQD24957.1 hypothetical protein FKV42_07765 [Methanolobus vulcani]
MKKMPLTVLIILMLMVVISGLADSDDSHPYSDDRQDDHRGRSAPPLDVFTLSPTMNEESFLEDNIDKSESMVLRLENASQELENKGNDVSDLKGMITYYSHLVSESRSYLEMANSAYSEDEKQKFLGLSRESIIKANSELKPILDEMKEYLPGPVILENNTLNAQGSGVAILSGDLEMSFFLTEGKFSVVDFDGNMIIDMDADYSMESPSERMLPTDLAKSHTMESYIDVTGNVSISGSACTVAIMADNMTLTATGQGEIELIGNGTYYLDNGISEEQENVWMIPIFERTDVGKPFKE